MLVQADAAVAVPGGVFLAALVLQHWWPASGPWRRLRVAHPEAGGEATGWLVVIAVVIGYHAARLAGRAARSPRR